MRPSREKLNELSALWEDIFNVPHVSCEYREYPKPSIAISSFTNPNDIGIRRAIDNMEIDQIYLIGDINIATNINDEHCKKVTERAIQVPSTEVD